MQSLQKVLRIFSPNSDQLVTVRALDSGRQ